MSTLEVAATRRYMSIQKSRHFSNKPLSSALRCTPGLLESTHRQVCSKIDINLALVGGLSSGRQRPGGAPILAFLHRFRQHHTYNPGDGLANSPHNAH